VLADLHAGSARDWHTRGIALLLLDRPEDAVRALEHAAQLASSSAEYRNDLATARLTLGETRGDAQELRRAIADAEAAQRLDAHSVAPLFNRAVALERLGESVEASKAYQSYLAVDASSEWADEVRWRLEHLNK
jgi:Flp pilus assembly protein TadD